MYSINAGDVVLSVFVTLILYGAFPVIFSYARKQTITRKKFRLYCIIATIAEWLLFSIASASLGGRVSNGAPAVIWGVIFYKLGIRTLTQKNMLIDDSEDLNKPDLASPLQNESYDTAAIESNPIFESESKIRTEVNDHAEKEIPMITKHKEKSAQEDVLEPIPNRTSIVKFCYKCGANLLEGSLFCSKCGTKVWVDDEK